MNPRQFEELVCEHFRKQGYVAKTTSYGNDYGVDVFASKGKEKIAIQAKMYGGSTRKVNRQMIMELYGAKDYFDCTKAVLATNGYCLPDALEVANKLKIEVLPITEVLIEPPPKQATVKNGVTFEQIWENCIMLLAGQTLLRNGGTGNKILKVDWGGVERITSNGNKGKIKIEIFKQAVDKLLAEGSITRDYINQNYIGRASSGVVLILSQVPFFELTANPVGLKYRK